MILGATQTLPTSALTATVGRLRALSLRPKLSVRDNSAHSLRQLSSAGKMPQTKKRKTAVAATADPAAVKANAKPLDGEVVASRAADMLDYINTAWTPFHAVDESCRRLNAAGFKHLDEKEAWELQPGGKYYFTRNMSSLVAFAVGEKYAPGNGFVMTGAHTDSPCLKLKPNSKSSKAGYSMINVECYGGGLWHTWFDRDLTVAGRVLVRDGDALVHKLVKIDRPIMRVPMLAIHLNRTIGTDGFKPNKQTHVAPILCTAVKGELEKTLEEAHGTDAPGKAASRNNLMLLNLLAEEVGCGVDDIVDIELNVCDVQPGVVGGITNEFVFVGRLDNLCSSYTCMQALIDAEDLAEETGVRACALFDHEEVGSDSAAGAGGPLMRDAMTRVARCLSEGQMDAVERALQKSFLVSADMAHAIHPNYEDKHEGNHRPQFHSGLVLKHNVNQRYATNAVTASLFREVADRAGIPVQEFCVRNDVPCGSTIGPILATNLGCRVIDVGMPQLSMHSIREMAGTDDIEYSYQHFKSFYETFSALDATLKIDELPPPSILGTIDDCDCQLAGRSTGPKVDYGQGK